MKKTSKNPTTPANVLRRDVLVLGASVIVAESAHAALLTGVEIVAPSTIVGGQSTPLVAKARYADGSSKVISAVWTIVGSGARIQGNSLLTSSTNVPVSVSISASYKELTITKIGYASVSIVPAQVKISGITGWSSGEGVVNGRWTGQAPVCATSPTRTDDYNQCLALESQKEQIFKIQGSNFTGGNSNCSVKFLDSSMRELSGVTVTVRNWSDTLIEVGVRSLASFKAVKPGWVRVTLDKNPPPTSGYRSAEFSVPGFAGVISSRGYGQCTWYVSYRRATQGLAVPADGGSIYSSGQRIAITSSYVPAVNDVLVYSGHVAYIESVSAPSYQGTGANRTTTWTIQVSEMNARCNETVTSDPRTFKVSASGTVVTGIGTRASSNMVALSYYR